MIPTLDQGLDAAKKVEGLKPTTVFIIMTLGLVTFLGWMYVGRLTNINDVVEANFHLLGNHNSQQNEKYSQMERYIRMQTSYLRELCVINARQAGTPDKVCFQEQ